MTPEEREAFYDAEVAPLLMSLCKQCQDRDISFLAMVDYTGTGDIGRTASLQADAPGAIRYANAISQYSLPRGAVNIDGFMFAVMKEARETGHSSIILEQLGVPVKPASAA